MTTHLLPTRDERARAAVEEIIKRALHSPAPTEVTVSARSNHSGEPALYVYVRMPDNQHIPEIPEQVQLSGELLTALQDIDDDRFPYVSYGPRNSDNNGSQKRETA